MIHGDFIFTGQVKEIMPYRERLLSQSKSSYYHPKNEFEPQKTIRFMVDKIYDKSRKQNDEVKEILADVVGSAIEPALSFEVGESYLIYATPRYYGRNDYNLKDNLIIYPDIFTQPISQSQERIRLLERSPTPTTLKTLFGLDSDEVVRLMRSGRGVRFPPPKYPVEAKGENIGGRVEVRVLVDENGNVIKAITNCAPNNSFIKVAEEAALKSSYTPTKVSGKPIKVATIIVYNFIAQ